MSGSSRIRHIRVDRVGFPPDTDELVLATGTDESDGQEKRFVVSPQEALSVLTALHAGRRPVIDVHDFDLVDWTVWWEDPAE
jgi:hypothetical protein